MNVFIFPALGEWVLRFSRSLALRTARCSSSSTSTRRRGECWRCSVTPRPWAREFAPIRRSKKPSLDPLRKERVSFVLPFFWAAQDLFHSVGESTLGLDGSHFASLVLKKTPTQSSKHILGRLFFGSTDQLARPSDIHLFQFFQVMTFP